MKLPRPFLISLVLFSGAAVATHKWRSERDSNPHASAPPSSAFDGLHDQDAAIDPSELTPEAIRALPLNCLHTIIRKLQGTPVAADWGKVILLYSRWAELEPREGLTALARRTGASAAKRQAGHAWEVMAAAAFLTTSLRLDPDAFPALLSRHWSEREKLNLIGLREMAADLLSPVPAALKAPVPVNPEDSAMVRGRIAFIEGNNRPEAALEALGQVNTFDARHKIDVILQDTLQKDPVKALELCQKVPHEEPARRVMKWALEKLSATTPAAALDYVVSHPGAAQTSEFLKECRPLLTATGPEAVLAAAAAVPDTDVRRELLGQAAAQVAKTDPAAAARMLPGIYDGAPLDETLLPLWSEIAAATASLSADRQGEWLAGLPAGPARDAAVSSLAYQHVQSGQIDAGFAMLEQVEDPVTRARTLTSLALGWKATGPNAADAWLRGPDTGLREDIRLALLKSWPGSLYTGPRP